MKSVRITGSPMDVEQSLANFLQNNPNIEIVGMSQSESVFYGSIIISVFIIFKEKSNDF